MLKNVVKTSFRFLSKNKVYTLINVLGLALGLATSMLIFLYISDELSYDKFHEDYENIHRVQEKYHWDDYSQFWATCDGSMATQIKANIKEGSYQSRIMSYFNPPFLYANARSAESGRAIFADSSFFKVFSFPLIVQQEDNLLADAEQVLISETVAQTLFGEEKALGEFIEVDGEQFKVSAVFNDVPDNSHIHFDVIFPMELLRESFPKLDSSGPMVFYTYVRSKDQNAKVELQGAMQKNMDDEIAKAFEKNENSRKKYKNLEAQVVFTPLQDIHLKSHAEKEYETNGNYEYILIYLTIAIFILLLASINYVNLATASSVKRAQEVGMRKVLGANRKNVFLHFISEAFLLVLGSTLAALVLVELSFPTLNEFAGKNLNMSMVWSSGFFIYLISIVFALTILSGLYPSIFMAGFNPLKVLSSRLNAKNNNKLNLILRRVLVVSQFSIAVFLSIASFTVGSQLDYIQTKDVGFDREHVLVIPFNGESGLKHLSDLKEDYLDTEGILSVTGSSNIPGERFGYYGIYMPSLKAVSDSTDGNKKRKAWLGVRMLCADNDFLSSFGFEIVDGRTFSADIPSDSNAFILNEAALRKYQIYDPIGKEVVFNYAVKTPKKGKIIGIVKDFHYASFHSEVDPLVIQVLPAFYRYVIIKLSSDNLEATISEIERKWHKHLPRTPFQHYLLSDTYENIYSSDKRMGNIFYFFTFIALFLAGLGLYGLVAFISEQRKAEIGIRKVLGASIGRLMFTMSYEFTILILVSNIIAWIPAWFFIKNWLSGFAFRVEFSLWPYVLTAFMSLAIGLITISIKTWLAAKANPVSILKYE